jgi:hypothetical protein
MSRKDAIGEDAGPTWFGKMGYAGGHRPHLASGERTVERELFGAADKATDARIERGRTGI